jgi:hypothetical protein
LFRRRQPDEASSRDRDYKPRLEHKVTVAPLLLTPAIVGILPENRGASRKRRRSGQGRATP